MMKKNLLTLFMFSVFTASSYAAVATPSVLQMQNLHWQQVTDMPAGAQFATLYGDPTKAEPFVTYVKLPANYAVPVHKHAIVENDTIIEGSYKLGFGSIANQQNTVTLAPGDFVSIPAETFHYGWAQDETIIEITGVGPWGMLYK